MKQRASEQGSALMLCLIIVIILVGISLAFTSISWWNSKRAFQDEASTQAVYAAESAAAIYINQLNATTSLPAQKPMTQISGSGNGYWIAQENLVDYNDATVVGNTNKDPDYCAFQVAAKVNKVTRRVNILLTHKSGGVFWNAIYAGNRSGDKSYNLGLSGKTLIDGTKVGDNVTGNVYSGGNVSADGYAAIYDMNGKSNGASVTYNGAFANGMTSTTVSSTQNKEPDLSIPRSFGAANNQLEAEFNAQKFASATDHRDTNTGVAWVDVANEVSKNGTANHQWVDGSYATDITDQNNAAHIFRKDPSSTSGASNNRTTTYEYAPPPAKSDYYLEDPTSKNVTQASLTGVPVNGDTTASMLNIKDSGNNAVYFIDGNMRVSGEPIKSYQLNPDPSISAVKMTMVVKGNVSLTDNLLYPQWMSKTDSVAIIAVIDPNFPNTTTADFTSGANVLPAAFKNKTGKTTAADFVADYNSRASKARSNGLNMPDIDLTTPDGQARASQEYNKSYGSGNVYFGDPGSGTVEHFEAFMYAENNFYATNLDTTKASGGTSKMEIYGNMTAGNQVNINRNTGTTLTPGYVPLSVTFDQSIMNGKGPPGLPQTPGVAGQDWHVLSWKQSQMTAEPNNAN